MATEDSTTDSIGLNLPGIGTRTNWATQYRQNFQQLDAILSGDESIPALDVTELNGSIADQSTITNLVGDGLSVDDGGTLNAQESMSREETLAFAMSRFTTPVGDA